MLEKIFNATTLKLIDFLALNPTHIRDIAEKLDTSPGYVHNILSFLKKEGIVTEKKEKNRKIICLNNKNFLIKHIRSLINIEKLLKAPGLNKLRKIGPIGIYGSFANGTNDKNSDVDLWLYTNKKLISFQNIVRDLENELNARVSLLILSKNKLNELKKGDNEFYIRLKLTSVIFGDDIFD